MADHAVADRATTFFVYKSTLTGFWPTDGLVTWPWPKQTVLIRRVSKLVLCSTLDEYNTNEGFSLLGQLAWKMFSITHFDLFENMCTKHLTIQVAS